MSRRVRGLRVLGAVLACLLGTAVPARAQNAPVIQQVPDQANYEQDTITPVTILASDPNNEALTIQVYSLPDGLTYDATTRTISGTISFAAEAGAGTDPREIWISATNTDGVLTWGHFIWSVTNMDAPANPAVVSPTLTRDSGGAYLISTPRGVPIAPVTLSSIDPDHCDEVHFQLDAPAAYPAGISLSEAGATNPTCAPDFAYVATLAGTPTSEGVYTFTVHDNRGDVALATFIWTVTNTAPTLTSLNDQSAVAGSAFSLTASGSDENGDTLSFTATGLPNGLVLNRKTGEFSGTPRATGSFTIGLTASDGRGGTASESFALSVSGTAVTPSCVPDANGNRVPGLWCSGDAFVGLGVSKLVDTTDENGDPTTVWAVQHPGEFRQLSKRGASLGPSIFDSPLTNTKACAVDRSGDLWTASLTQISHIAAPTATLAPQLLAPIDVASHVSTEMCGSIAAFPWLGCGAATSVALDRAGNIYAGTVYGTNQILKFDSTGAFVTAFTVPVGERGTEWIDLAADQQTMFYTSHDNTIRVFRLDGQPLASALFDAGVEHLEDAVLDPDNLGLFGQILVKDWLGNPLGSPMNRVRILPPGDGSGGLMMVYSTAVFRIDLSGTYIEGYPSGGNMYPLWTLEMGPDGKSAWMLTAPNADWSQPSVIGDWHLPTNTAVVSTLAGTDWAAADALCVKDAYVAALVQPDCVTDPSNSMCQPVTICPADSPDCNPPLSPVFTVPADRTDTEGDMITPFTIVATDPDNRPLTYDIGVLPEGITYNSTTHLVSGTIGWHAAEGSYGTVRVDVTNDRGLLTRKSFGWTIINRNAPPSATVSPTFTRNSEGAFVVSTPRAVAISTVILSGNDPDACDGVNFYLHAGTALPAGLSLTPAGASNPTCSNGFIFPASITGTPTTDGTTTFTVESDSVSPLATFAWTVTNTAPTLAPISAHQASTNTAFELAVAAADANNDTLTFSATNLPPGITIDSTTGVMSGTPMTSGTTTVIVTVGDGHGGSASRSFELSVGGLSNPAITSISPDTGVAGTAVTVTGSGFGEVQGLTTLWLGTKSGIVTSWGDTQIIATVAPGSQSGSVVVKLPTVTSNALAFTVLTPVITSVTPESGPAGTPVSIYGSAFGPAQGVGQVRLGAAIANVTSWSDSHVAVVVSPSANSGGVQLLQNGVWSNAVSFTVTGGTPKLTSVSPNSGGPGDPITIDGANFGAVQGSGSLTIAGSNASIVSWSDTEISALVPNGAVTGAVKVRQNGLWSNPLRFLSALDNSGMIITPDVANLLVGESRGVQALDATGAAISGLTWSSSDPDVVALSSDDPPLLLALAAGTATVTGGSGAVDVTVHSGTALAAGTVLWSDPGTASGVIGLLPAIPSATGVADVFGFQGDGSVQALRADGTVVWTSAPPADFAGGFPQFIPNFQGGLVSFDGQSIYALDAQTGAASWSPYVASTDESRQNGLAFPLIHTDGTIVTIETACSEVNCPDSTDIQDGAWVVGIDPVSGSAKFRVSTVNSTGHSNITDDTAAFCQQVPGGQDWKWHAWPDLRMIAGDGFAYLSYISVEQTFDIRRADSQLYPDATLDLAVSFINSIDVDNHNYGAEADHLQALSDALPTGDTFKAFLLSGEVVNGEFVNTIDNIRDGHHLLLEVNVVNIVNQRFARLCETSAHTKTKLHFLSVNSSGTSSDTVVEEWPESHDETLVADLSAPLGAQSFTGTRTQTGPASVDTGLPWAITNADVGAVYSWQVSRECAEPPEQTDECDRDPEYHITRMVNGAKASDVKWHPPSNGAADVVRPLLQLEDGSFAGAYSDGLLVFNARGETEWSVPGGYPTMATSGGGLVANVGGGYYAFDANGASTGQVEALPQLSWTGGSYQLGSVESVVASPVLTLAATFQPMVGANPSGNGTAVGFKKDVTIVSWIDKNAVSFPPVGSVSSLLVGGLNALDGLFCAAEMLRLRAGNNSAIASDADRRYVNAFLLYNSANAEPPHILDSSVLKGGNFRAYNEVRLAVAGNQMSNAIFSNPQPVLGNTPDACSSVVVGMTNYLLYGGNLFRPQPHPDNGKKGPTPDGQHVFQLAEGRVGDEAQAINMTVNSCSSKNLAGLCNAAVPGVTPFIWSYPLFDAQGQYTVNTQIFPTHYIYENGVLVEIRPQSPAEDFIGLTATSQIRASDIR